MSVLDNTYKGLYGNHAGKTFDKLLEIVPAETAQVDDTASAIVEIGTGLLDADLVLQVEASSGANTVTIQFSADEAFTTLIVGVLQAIPAMAQPGLMIIPFRNAYANEQPAGFMRLMPAVGGTLAMGAFIAKK